MMRAKFITGFTLLELIIALSISATILGVGLPTMSNLLNANRVVGQVNALRGDLALTRSEAIRRNQQVVICKSHDGQHCNPNAAWDQGWIVYVDANQNKERDEEEALIQIHNELPNGNTLTYRGFGSHNYIAYQPTGITQMNGTFTLCSSQAPERSRALILMKTGRVRLSSTKPDGGALNCGSSINSAS